MTKWVKIELISSTPEGLFIGLFYHYDFYALIEITLLIIHSFIHLAISYWVPVMEEQDRQGPCPHGVLYPFRETSNKDINQTKK